MKPNPLNHSVRRHNSGFSLIEILIVVGIIALIMGIVANQIFGQRDVANARLAKSQMSTLVGKIESYQLDNGQPPERLEDLVTAPGGSTTWLGPYAKQEELRDPWGNAIEYRRPGEQGAYDLISFGKDGKAGGQDHARDIVVSN